MEEESYQKFERRAKELFPNINPATLKRVAEKSYSSFTTIGGVSITYKPCVSIPEKQIEFSKNKNLLCTNRVGDKILVTFPLNLETLIDLSEDKDVKMID